MTGIEHHDHATDAVVLKLDRLAASASAVGVAHGNIQFGASGVSMVFSVGTLVVLYWLAPTYRL